MKYRLRPSVAYRLQPTEKGTKWTLELYYESGSKHLVIELDGDGHSFFQRLIGEGVSLSDQFSNIFRERGLLAPDTVFEPHLASDNWLHRLNLFLLDQPEFPDLNEIHASMEKITISIIGLGGIGSNTAHALARSGFSSFVLVDPDHVSENNLNRQSLFFHRDVGTSKSHILSDRLKEINPRISTLPLISNITELRQQDIENTLVINCADEPNIFHNTLHIFDKFEKIDQIFVGGGYYGSKSFVGPFVGRQNYSAIQARASETSKSSHISAVGGNTFFTAALPAAFLSNEILRFAIGEPLLGIDQTMLMFDWNSYHLEKLPL